jgi:uncharacterized protein (TIRG00374 family)
MINTPMPESLTSNKRTSRKSLLLWALRVAFGLVILIYIFTFIPFSDVILALRATKGSYVTLAFAFLVLERFVAAIRMRILTDGVGMSLSVHKIWEINTIALFYGMFLPGDLAGGAVRWYKLSQPEKKRAEAAAAITFDRLIDTIALLVLGMFFWFVEVPPIAYSGITVVFFVLLFGLLLGLCLSLSRRLTSFLLKPLEKNANRFGLQFVYPKLIKVVESVWQYRRLSAGNILSLTVLSALRQVLSLLIMFFFALALEMEISFVALGWIRSFMNVLTMLPISFSGLGIREGSLVILLDPYGVSGSLAVALSFLTFITHILLATVGGVLEIKNLLFGGRFKEKATEPSSHADGQTH